MVAVHPCMEWISIKKFLRFKNIPLLPMIQMALEVEIKCFFLGLLLFLTTQCQLKKKMPQGILNRHFFKRQHELYNEIWLF